MSGFTDILKTIAPTVASAVLGPMGGAAVTAIGGLLGVSEPTQDKIAKIFSEGGLTPDQLSKLRELEMQYKNEEAERGFKYEELIFKDRDSARNMAIQTQSNTPATLTWIIVLLTLSAEIAMLFQVMPSNVDPIILGRVLGTMDMSLGMVLAFWFGTNSGSVRKTELLAASTPPAR